LLLLNAIWAVRAGDPADGGSDSNVQPSRER
jgi:hypothetical protein